VDKVERVHDGLVSVVSHKRRNRPQWIIRGVRTSGLSWENNALVARSWARCLAILLPFGRFFNSLLVPGDPTTHAEAVSN
jgi:hypothetical protein